MFTFCKANSYSFALKRKPYESTSNVKLNSRSTGMLFKFVSFFEKNFDVLLSNNIRNSLQI